MTCKKLKLPSKPAAEAHARQRKRSAGFKGPCVAYHCAACMRWHVRGL